MKLFVTDYDNTLHVEDKNMKKTIKKLKELQKKDYLIMISTGRAIRSIQEEIQRFNIPFDYVSCADGSVVYDNNYQLIKHFVMDNTIMKELDYLLDNVTYEKVQFSHADGYSHEINDDKDLSSINIVITNENMSESVMKRYKKLEKKYPQYNYLIYYHEPYYYLCIKAYEVSKSSTIKYMSDLLKATKIEVIGDSDNDYEMIKDFNGVCVSIANDNVKKVSKKIYKNIDLFIDELKKNQD